MHFLDLFSIRVQDEGRNESFFCCSRCRSLSLSLPLPLSCLLKGNELDWWQINDSELLLVLPDNIVALLLLLELLEKATEVDLKEGPIDVTLVPSFEKL